MCGIAGVLIRDGSRPDDRVLAEMAQQLAHRGPDGQGVRSFAGCGLAHRRLSIIDLSDAANQPMSTADGRRCVVFNGEIYNFLALRQELSALGHRFVTQGDTEVILAAWDAWGEACFARLDGMFAIALWDEGQKVLVLARDRLGKKPLYVYEDERRVVFGSELKGILAHPGLDRTLAPAAVPLFLAHGYVPTPGTFYARIRKVEPSTCEVFSLPSRSWRARRYWDIPTEVTAPLEGDEDVERAGRRVRELFFEAVRKRLVSDVPLGAFLSGGVDSTLVVAAMAELTDKPVKTFSIGFEGHPEWDETHYARLVARRYGTDHTEFKVRPESFDLFEKLAWHYDEPFGDSSAIPSYVVSKLTREKVTVALTGDGGDELFAGYPRFAAALYSERVPRPLRSAAAFVGRLLPRGSNHDGVLARGRRLALQSGRELPERLRGWVSIFTTEQLLPLLKPAYRGTLTSGALGVSYVEAFNNGRSADRLNQVLYATSRTYLLDDLNVKMDRASMAASLETRAPFMDTALTEYVSRLPGDAKLRGRTTKWILKKGLGDLIPPEVLSRPKMGFGVPLGAWFRGDLGSVIETRLTDASSPLAEYLEADEMKRIIGRNRAGLQDAGLQLWSLAMLDSFLRRERAGA